MTWPGPYGYPQPHVAPPKRGRPLAWAGAVVAALAIGAVGAWVTRPQASAYVACAGSPAAGYACSVRHAGGNAPARVCWELQLQCANGVSVVSAPCLDVNVSQVATRNVDRRELVDVAKCDRVRSVAVEQVTVTPK